jgi:uncharacterized protein
VVEPCRAESAHREGNHHPPALHLISERCQIRAEPASSVRGPGTSKITTATDLLTRRLPSATSLADDVAVARRDEPDRDQFSLRTFRRDGSSVARPIWLARAEDHWYAYTPIRSWMVQRIRHTPRVEIAPSDFNGEPHSEWRPRRARILPSSEIRAAKRAMTAKYRNKFRLFTIVTLIGRPRKYGGRAVGLEITLDPGYLDRVCVEQMRCRCRRVPN